MGVRIAVIDSNVDLKHPLISNANIVVHKEKNDSGKQSLHGTTICYEIFNQMKDVEIHVYPIISDSNVYPEKVISVLDKINHSSEPYDVINMSLGFSDPLYHDEIANVCDALASKGTILVAAFDNWGVMTYPACLDSVIGVDLYNGKDNIKNYVYLDNKCINIMAPRKQSIMATESGTSIATSTSQFTAHITGMIGKYIQDNGNKKKELILEYLKQKADKAVTIKTTELEHYDINYGKCMVFPYNKEIQSLIKLNKWFYGELSEVFDFKYSKYLGKKIDANGEIYEIKNIEKANIEQFDTIIIGHLDRYDNELVDRVLKFLLAECTRLNKRIYALDSFIRKNYSEKYNCKVVEPSINKENVPVGQGGKMWSVDIPVVAVVGTNLHQGKFTSQIHIRENLKAKGYHTGFVSTEPTGYLVGADYVFPYGYNADIDVSYDEYAIVMNEMIYRTYCMEKDIIITGLQSGMLPINYYNVGQNSYIQHAVMFGLNPDTIILCVSMDDNIDLVKRTMQCFSAIYQADVMGILMYPVQREVTPAGNIIYKEEIDREKLCSKVSELRNQLKLPVYAMDSEGYANITNDLVDLLTN